jgi:hypothetical protein
MDQRVALISDLFINYYANLEWPNTEWCCFNPSQNVKNGPVGVSTFSEAELFDTALQR